MGSISFQWWCPWLLAASILVNIASVSLNVFLSTASEKQAIGGWADWGPGWFAGDGGVSSHGHDVDWGAELEPDGQSLLPWSTFFHRDRFWRRDGRRAASTEGDAASQATGSNDTACADDHANGSGHNSDHDGPHQHDALLFLFTGLILGSAVMHVHLYYPFMQQTVILFIVGLVVSLIFEGTGLKKELGVVGDSYDMWMGIDPHLLLFTLLPLLLAGDAMTIDTSVAAHVGYQCLYLAGPGVIVQCLVIAGFLAWYLEWSFFLSMVTSSMLCATDPVAVVALLKELGASPTLTVQIQGESLLNDGTAIVVFTICYNTLSGEDYDFEEVVMFLVKTAMMALALGMFIGYFFFGWIRLAGNRLHSHSSMLQISLTLCCAYSSYVVAEGIFHVSGVLSCVAASLVLAHHMWPHIVHAETLQHVWHTFEALGNILIFFLAGALTGDIMVEIEAQDYLRLGVIYLVLLFVRGLFVFLSRPVLRLLNADRIPVTKADAAVITWGGLRGAVGVALAIQVHRERAPNSNDVEQVSTEDGPRVLFFVSGIAFLTTIINATTAPALVRNLGITALPDAQLRLLRMLNEQLVQWSTDHKQPEQVTSGLRTMLDHLDAQISNHQTKQTRFSRLTQSLVNMDLSSLWQNTTISKMNNNATDNEEGGIMAAESSASYRSTEPEDGAQENAHLVESLRYAEEGYRAMLQADGGLGMLVIENQGGGISKGVNSDNLLLQIDDMIGLLKGTNVDVGMAKVVNRAFLSLVRCHYWKQIESGDLRPGSDEAETLLTSVEVALSPLRADLMDFRYIEQRLKRHNILSDDEWWEVFPTQLVREQDHPSVKQASAITEEAITATRNLQRRKSVQQLRGLARAVGSAWFNIGISAAIVLNGLWIALEENYREDETDRNILWLLGDAIFTVIFTLEFLLKVSVMHSKYFKDGSNVFDFVLVVLGIFGLSMSIAAYIQEGGKGTSDITGVIRISRVFRVLRFLRLFRLFNAKLSRDKLVSHELSCIMYRIMTCMSFIGAHLASQKLLIKYFGGNGKIDSEDEVEIARCIAQSQLCVYKAIEVVVSMERHMSAELVSDLKFTLERKEVAEALEEFVMGALQDGAITAREAESILHPLHHQIADCLALLNDTTEGILRHTTKSTSGCPASPGGKDDWKDPTKRGSSQITTGSAKYPELSEALAETRRIISSNSAVTPAKGSDGTPVDTSEMAGVLPGNPSPSTGQAPAAQEPSTPTF